MPHQNPDQEISLLEVLRSRPNSGQRDMAEAIGMSLGMTNLLLKDLSARGWMLMRKLSPRKVQYILTPEGLRELTNRSYRYLKKSIRNVADCRDQLEALVIGAKKSGSEGIVLVGTSEVDFVVDHLCRVHGLAFRVHEEPTPEAGWFIVHGENEPQKRPNILEFMDPIVS